MYPGMASVLLHFKISSSISASNIVQYDGARFVSIAVPRYFFKVLSLKAKILFLRTTSASSSCAEVLTSFPCLKSVRSRRADRPLPCGMLEYKPTISTVHKTISSGKVPKE